MMDQRSNILNLIEYPWILVQTSNGPATIRPDQIADNGVLALNWPRADFNVACMELLIGLLHMAIPPEDNDDWSDKNEDLTADDLRVAFAPWAPFFNLAGPGPKFLQDFHAPLSADAKPVDALFIDSAGENAVKQNKDVMAWRARYTALSPAVAAMALYTLQTQAPSGGKGYRTSIRGGGPMTTLIEPVERSSRPLWDLVWVNVPLGSPQDPNQGNDLLPWCSKTRISEGTPAPVVPPPSLNDIVPEMFFCQPRRLDLVWGAGTCSVTSEVGPVVTGVRQEPWGANYEGWKHPLSPHYRAKAG